MKEEKKCTRDWNKSTRHFHCKVCWNKWLNDKQRPICKEETQKMLKEIYEEIADKELTFWCKVSFFTSWREKELEWKSLWEIDNIRKSCINIKWKDNKLYREWLDDIEIIWHPIMIGDVLKWVVDKKNDLNRVICERCWSDVYYQEAQCSHPETGQNDFDGYWECTGRNCDSRYNRWQEQSMNESSSSDYIARYCLIEDWQREKLDKPLDDQSEECISFIHSLVKRWK
jgi:hypothetical protein